MERYDYNEAVKNDVLDYIKENYTAEEIAERLADVDGWSEKLNDELWTADSVTGNGSGSYYCNAWKAEESICHNLELLAEALQEFGSGADYLERGAEACDVTIRCYLLGGAISEALEELAEEFPPLDPSKIPLEESIKKTSSFDFFCACFSECKNCPFNELEALETQTDCESYYNERKAALK